MLVSQDERIRYLLHIQEQVIAQQEHSLKVVTVR